MGPALDLGPRLARVSISLRVDPKLNRAQPCHFLRSTFDGGQLKTARFVAGFAVLRVPL